MVIPIRTRFKYSSNALLEKLPDHAVAAWYLGKVLRSNFVRSAESGPRVRTIFTLFARIPMCPKNSDLKIK